MRLSITPKEVPLAGLVLKPGLPIKPDCILFPTEGFAIHPMHVGAPEDLSQGRPDGLAAVALAVVSIEKANFDINTISGEVTLGE